MSAAFASRSSQRTHAPVSEGPSFGSYDPAASSTIAAKVAGGRKSIGSFGSSVRDLNWGKQQSARDAPSSEPTSAETAPLRSTFGSGAKRPPRGPSAAMGGGSRFKTKEATGGDFYVPSALGESKSVNGNRRTSLLGTMGSTKRFTEVKVSAPGDYSDARPSAFSSSSKKAGASNTGFGGTTSRVTAFDAAAKRAQENSSSHLQYDGALKGTGAFAKATEVSKNGSSAAFASKSTQRTALPVSEGPSAQAYNNSSVGSIAASANKSFNKSLQQGTGGFGTSSKRGSEINSARNADAPGPGEYAPDVVDVSDAHHAKPSSAFASTTRKGETHLRPMVDADYGDAHQADGMAATAAKSFNKKAGTSAFGPRTVRQYHDTKDTPGPGDYTHADPSRPTVERANAKGKMSGAFASTTLRDTTAGFSAAQSGFSSFLP